MEGSTGETTDNADPLEPGGRERQRSARSAERASERERLADRLAERGIRDERVLAAIRTVPRHWFVPAAQQSEAYDDVALPIGHGQTISQPFIVALMTEALELKPESRVLEVGTGCGYQAAVLSEIAARVYTIEIVPELAACSCERLERLGYANVVCRSGDGASGWREEAPFDAVLVAAAPVQIPGALIDQLAVGGRMCIPLGADLAEQELVKLVKRHDGSCARESLAPVRFVPMTSAGTR